MKNPDGGPSATNNRLVWTFAKGTSVTLSAEPLAGSFFTTWSGGCAGSGACVANIDRDVTVGAQLDSIEGDRKSVV